MHIISTAHDSEGLFVPWLKKFNQPLAELSSSKIVAVTAATSVDTRNLLEQADFAIVDNTSFGQGRRAALRKAAESGGGETFWYCDLDKILHWLNVQPKELERILSVGLGNSDLVVFGRTKAAFTTYPESWVRTEEFVNLLMSRILGMDIDVYTSSCLFNREVADILLKNAQETDGWGSTVEWILLPHLSGLKVSFQAVDGLDWENPDIFRTEMEAAGGLAAWKESRYATAAEWIRRTESILDMLKVIERLVGASSLSK